MGAEQRPPARAPASRGARAPAKVNLFLHVLGRRPDGYHLIESLVTFAEMGDDLALVPGEGLSLAIEGPFAGGLEPGEDNLVLRAARAFAAHIPHARLGAFRLAKTLPIASGIGGGSSDAAAAIRLLCALNQVAADDPRLLDIAASLGADVPVCLDPSAPRLMRGIGHELGPRLAFRQVPALLVNPGIAVPTAAVFSALGLLPGARRDAPAGSDFRMARNDLEPPAIAFAPVIAGVLRALGAARGCELARMSGSGATCFGLFGDDAAADDAAARIAAANPGWWIAPTRLAVPF